MEEERRSEQSIESRIQWLISSRNPIFVLQIFNNPIATKTEATHSRFVISPRASGASSSSIHSASQTCGSTHPCDSRAVPHAYTGARQLRRRCPSTGLERVSASHQRGEGKLSKMMYSPANGKPSSRLVDPVRPCCACTRACILLL